MKRLALTFFLTGLLVVALTGCNELKDSRDGKPYKTVKIGDQTWLAENLNYKTEYSYCYEEKEANCAKYGRLYVWYAAMEACPVGWHLPSKAELEELLKTIGSKQAMGKKRLYWEGAAKKLKSAKGWKKHKGKNGNGKDAFGFSALPAGSLRYHMDDSVSFSNKGTDAYFWSSTEYGEFCAYYMRLGNRNDNGSLPSFSRLDGFSVRCLKD